MLTCVYKHLIDSLRNKIFLSDLDNLYQIIDIFLSDIKNIIRQEKELKCFIEYEMMINEIILFLKKIEKTNRIEESIEALNGAIHLIVIEREKRYNEWHETKRCYSFHLFDHILSCCERGICYEINDRQHYYLVDISIDGYVNNRAYYYSIDKIGIDDNDRHLMAINKINNVFNCTKRCFFDTSIFDNDLNQIEFFHRNSVRNRKSYWTYMANKNGDPVDIFCKTCDFLERQKLYIDSGNRDSYKKLLLDNRDKSSAFDLFRLCSIDK